MKNYLSIKVTTYSGGIKEMACTHGNASVIGILASNNRNVFVTEVSVPNDVYDKIEFISISKLCS